MKWGGSFNWVWKEKIHMSARFPGVCVRKRLKGENCDEEASPSGGERDGGEQPL